MFVNNDFKLTNTLVLGFCGVSTLVSATLRFESFKKTDNTNA